jgi:hypothetical protein
MGSSCSLLGWGQGSILPSTMESKKFAGFVFFSSRLSVYVTFTVLLPPHDTRHTPPPYCTHVLPLPLPALPLHPCLWFPSLTPSKTCPARLNSHFLGTSLKCLGPPQDLLPPFDVGQVPLPPPNPPTMHFLSHVVPFPCQTHSPELHFFGVFFATAGTAAQKVSFPPSPPLLCCFSSAPYSLQPSCTTHAPFLLSFPSEIPPLHPNPPFFSFCV